MRKIFLTFFIIIVLLQNLHSQINHYGMTQIGARSTMLGGAIIGDVQDNSAIFYNPAGMAFINNSSISATGDAAFVDIVKYKNGAGDGVDLQSSSMEVIPSMISGVVKDKKRPWLTLNYAIINYGISRTNMHASYSGTRDVMSSNPGEEYHYGTFEFSNETREDWIAAGRAYKLNENFGLGASMFIAFRSQSQTEHTNVSAFTENQDNTANTLGYNIDQNSMRYNNVGVFFKVGWAYRFDKIKMGGNITTPRASIYLVSNAYINRSSQKYIPPYNTQTEKIATFQSKVPNQYKSPWIIDYGISSHISRTSTVFLSATYFHAINKYSILKEYNPNDIEKILSPQNLKYNNVNIANKAVVNLALGYEYRFSENLTMLYGFRTDFNHADIESLEQELGYVPAFSNYDIYHLSGGVDYNNKKFILNLGINTAMGFSKNNQQFIDLSNPTDENLLVGDLSHNVDASFFRIGVLFGFTYFFAN